MNANKENQTWISRFQAALGLCGVELRKATRIGEKMLSASQSNTELHEYYERLGLVTMAALKNNELSWSNETVKEIVDKIDSLRSNLSSLEEDVQLLKSED